MHVYTWLLLFAFPTCLNIASIIDITCTCIPCIKVSYSFHYKFLWWTVNSSVLLLHFYLYVHLSMWTEIYKWAGMCCHVVIISDHVHTGIGSSVTCVYMCLQWCDLITYDLEVFIRNITNSPSIGTKELDWHF